MMSKNVKWNKEFYERCRDIFPINVFYEISTVEENSSMASTGHYWYPAYKLEVYYAPLDLGGIWKASEDGKFIEVLDEKGKLVKYKADKIFLSIPDEVSDIFEDLEPWDGITYSATYTTTF